MTTKLLEYSGLIVNYGCLALAVFGGWWAGAAEQGAGGLAARVSLASFYLLTLVYSYTQVRLEDIHVGPWQGRCRVFRKAGQV
jgi:hypothetical protein